MWESIRTILLLLLLGAFVVGFSHLLTGCAGSGVRLSAIGTDLDSSLQNFKQEEQIAIIEDQSEEVIEEHSTKKYPLNKEWPARWHQYHRYAEIVNCDINFEGWKTCTYIKCGMVESHNHIGIALIGKHVNTEKQVINIYYDAECALTENTLPEGGVSRSSSDPPS